MEHFVTFRMSQNPGFLPPNSATFGLCINRDFYRIFGGHFTSSHHPSASFSPSIAAWYLAAACGGSGDSSRNGTGGDRKGTWQTREATISCGYVLGNTFGYHSSC